MDTTTTRPPPAEALPTESQQAAGSSPARLNLLRIGYLVTGLGLAVVAWRSVATQFVPASGDAWRR
jgi:hypothetical protein